MKFTDHLIFWIRSFTLFLLVAVIVLAALGAFGSLAAAVEHGWKFILLSAFFVLVTLFFGALLSYLTERWEQF